MSAIEFSTPFRPSDLGGSELFMALPGSLMSVAINKFTVKQGKNDPARALHSLGIGRHSLCATDTRRAIVFGHPERSYVTTDRRKVLSEADRAKNYGNAFDAGRVLPVEDQEDPENTPPDEPYPPIGPIVNEVKSMRFLAKVWPEALRDVAAIALASGTGEVELFIGGTEEQPRLGFRFVHHNAQPAFGEAHAVPVLGVVTARGKDNDRRDDDEGGDEE